LIVSAGAVAAAGIAIFGFWDRIFPPDVVDSAKVESVDMVGSTTLHEFAFTGTTFPLEAVPRGAGPGGAEMVVALPTSVPVVPPTVQPTLKPPGSTARPTTTRSPADTPPLDRRPEQFDTTPTPTSLPGAGSWLLPQGYTHAVADDPVFDDLGLDPSDLRKVAATRGDFRGPAGETLSPHQVAENLRDALSAVESAGSESSDPLGWTVAVDLSLEGLDGVPCLLTWSLDGADVPVSWSSSSVAYRVVASTPRDAGSARIWVPDLKAEGTYRVNVTLVRESDGIPIAHGKPLEIPNP
jgi:hypothetical protein